MTEYVLAIAALILACLFLSKISGKVGIPSLALFIVLGMILGSDGLFKVEFDDFKAAEEICSVALIFIIFYGGFGTKWKKAGSVVAPASLLSTQRVPVTAGGAGVFCHEVLGLDVW